MQALSVGVGPRTASHGHPWRSRRCPSRRLPTRRRAAQRDQRRLAAVLAAGPGAALSHRSAVDADRCVAVSRRHRGGVPSTAAVLRLDGVLVHRIADLVPSDIRQRARRRCDLPARTVVDLGLVARRPVVQRVMEQWLANKVVAFADSRRRSIESNRQGRIGSGVRGRSSQIVPSVRPWPTPCRRAPSVSSSRARISALTHHHLVVLPSGATLSSTGPTRTSATASKWTVRRPSRSNEAFERRSCCGATSSRSTAGRSSSSPGPPSAPATHRRRSGAAHADRPT